MKKIFLYFSFFIFHFSIIHAQQIYVVSTFAGTDTVGNDTINTAGYRNGADSLALFNGPAGIAADTFGNVYVADTYNNVIRKIRMGMVTTLAGNDTAGYRNGIGAAAEFRRPMGICVDKYGNVFVADTYNNVIREISIAGNVITYAGNGIPGYSGDGGPATSAELNLPVGVAADTIGDIFVTDNENQVIRKISASGTISTFAGTNTIGYKNGQADSAKFMGLYGIAVDDSGTVYITEYINDDVRKIRNGIVTTLAGNDTNIVFHSNALEYPFGYRNGINDTSLFYDPTGIVVDNSTGNVYVSDEYNNVIREIRKDSVTTFAGSSTNVVAGYINGNANSAEFNAPLGLALDRKDNFYVADNGNNIIRKIKLVNVTWTSPVIQAPKLSMVIYPNPCSSRLIVANAPEGKATMFDVVGKEVWSNENFKAPCILNTGSFRPGVYFLRVQNIAGAVTQKVVVEP